VHKKPRRAAGQDCPSYREREIHLTQISRDEYVRGMRAKNRERYDYVRSRLSQLLEQVDHEFTGKILVEVPVLKGTVGRIEFTVSDRQME